MELLTVLVSHNIPAFGHGHTLIVTLVLNVLYDSYSQGGGSLLHIDPAGSTLLPGTPDKHDLLRSQACLYFHHGLHNTHRVPICLLLYLF